MVFEFAVHPSFSFVESFGKKFNIPVYKNSLKIPAELGEGQIRLIEVMPGFKFVLHHYILKQDFCLKRLPAADNEELISIVFNSNEIPVTTTGERETAISFLKDNGSSIQIAATAWATETFFPAGSEVYFGVIGIKRLVLSSLLRAGQTNGALETILSGNGQFFYHEKMSPEIQRTLKQVSEITDQDKLGDLYYNIKTHELLYLLFHKLMDRSDEKQSPVNKADVEKMYLIRTAILADLSVPPSLVALAKMAAISETKMKQLFKQTFGDSIYNYYQNERMQEAGFLLKHTGHSVSEVGYRLGFSNLSHFSRLFEKHYGVTPKKYTLAG